MISSRLRNLIEPQLRMLLEPKDYSKIDYLFSNAYLVKYDGMDLIAIPAVEGDYAGMEFSTLNGAFIQMDFWERVVKVGEKL